jgi:hypothetical protein
MPNTQSDVYLTWINSFLGVDTNQRGPGGPPAASTSDAGAIAPAPVKAAPRDPRAANAVQEPATQRDKDRLDVLTMEVIGSKVVDHLLEQYMDLAVAVREVVDDWSSTIEKLKEEAPKESGTLISQLGKTLLTICEIAFPEMEIVDVAVTVKDVAEKVDKSQERRSKAEETAALKAQFRSKMAAKDALNAFAKHVMFEAQKTRSRLVERVRQAVESFVPPSDFDKATVKNFEKKAQKFAVEQLGIKIGTDQDPSVIGKVRAQLGGDIGKWLKQQYVAEHETQGALKRIGIGPGTGLSKVLAQQVLADPDSKEEIDKELRGEYTEEFKKRVLDPEE